MVQTLEEYTKQQLYQRAIKRGIDGRSTMNKMELVKALRGGKGFAAIPAALKSKLHQLTTLRLKINSPTHKVQDKDLQQLKSLRKYVQSHPWIINLMCETGSPVPVVGLSLCEKKDPSKRNFTFSTFQNEKALDDWVEKTHEKYETMLLDVQCLRSQ